MVPDRFWRQLRRVARRRHHRSSRDSNSSTTSQPSERRIQMRRMLLQLSTQLCSPNEKISLQVEYVPLSTVLSASGDSSLIFLSDKVAQNIEKQVEKDVGKQAEDNIGSEVGKQVCDSKYFPTSSSSFIPQNTCQEEGQIIRKIEQQQKQRFFCRYFRCSAKVRIDHLKRLLESKLAMTEFYGIYFVDPELRFVLEDDFTLEVIFLCVF